jgi:hypothetical protein
VRGNIQVAQYLKSETSAFAEIQQKVVKKLAGTWLSNQFQSLRNTAPAMHYYIPL